VQNDVAGQEDRLLLVVLGLGILGFERGIDVVQRVGLNGVDVACSEVDRQNEVEVDTHLQKVAKRGFQY